MAREVVPANARALKIVVIVLGIVFLAMLVVFIVGVFMRFGHKTTHFQATLRLQPGKMVTEVTGVGDRLVLRVKGPEGQDRLIFVDPASGRRVGTLDLVQGP